MNSLYEITALGCLLILACLISFSRRFQSLTGQDTINLSAAGANGQLGSTLVSAELEMLKQEILSEVRAEIQQAKQDIIEGKPCYIGLRWRNEIVVIFDKL